VSVALQLASDLAAHFFNVRLSLMEAIAEENSRTRHNPSNHCLNRFHSEELGARPSRPPLTAWAH